jgi:hypothetical protein
VLGASNDGNVLDESLVLYTKEKIVKFICANGVVAMKLGGGIKKRIKHQ